ncbi:hypothetical protein [Sulfitobacter sp. G21635-S1]|uniref:hypothetical protein n=1 Tax=Sulfitobacter sp. G21635-S1 TaxID=3014043 RepID=UPI0022B01C4F|nr:hypothetical protein [Sulfitobacter sp. G21635-S1]
MADLWHLRQQIQRPDRFTIRRKTKGHKRKHLPTIWPGGVNFPNPAPGGSGRELVGDSCGGCCAIAAVAGCQNDKQQCTGCNCRACAKTGTGCVERATIVILNATTCTHTVDCFDFSFAAVDLAIAALNPDRVVRIAGFTQDSCLSCILCGCTCGNGHCYSCGKCENLFHLDQTPKSISVHNSYDTYQKSLKAMYRIHRHFAPADTKKSHKKQENIGEKMLIARYNS